MTILIKAATPEPPLHPFPPFRFSNEVQPEASPSNAPYDRQNSHSQLARNNFQQCGANCSKSPRFMGHCLKMKETLFKVILYIYEVFNHHLIHHIYIIYPDGVNDCKNMYNEMVQYYQKLFGRFIHLKSSTWKGYRKRTIYHKISKRNA